jgi:AraC-like DNA-binding protein
MKKNKTVRLSEQDKKCLEDAGQFISANLSHHYTLQEISARAGINRYKLTYGFKQLFGSSIHQFLIKKRIAHAQILLQEGTKPLKEIAQLNGYKRVENFITAFKKYSGITPNRFKKG